MSEEAQDFYFPEWIERDYANIKGSLSLTSAKELDKFRDTFSILNRKLSQLPEQITLDELYQIKPDKLKMLFPDRLSALVHACEYLVGYWAFQHAYKLKSAFEGFTFSLERGNFLLAFSCSRAMLEETAHFHFFLSKLETNHRKITELERNEAKAIKQGKQPTDRLIKEFTTCHLEIITKLEKAIQGSNYDWKGWFMQTYAKYSASDSNDQNIAGTHSQSRRTHINDCLENLEKKTGVKACQYYDIFSEMVHPNFGSNSLVIVTRERHNELLGQLVLSSTPRNVESASWFFEIASTPLHEIFLIASKNIANSQTLLKFYQELSQTSTAQAG